MNKRVSFVLLAGLLSACGSNNDSAAPTDDDVKATLPAAPTTIPLGKAGEVSDMAYTVQSVELKQRLAEEIDGPKAGPGEAYVVIRYSIKNLRKKPVDWADLPGVQLVDGSGQSYEEDDQGGMTEAIANEDTSGAINPKVSSRKTSVWRVDKASFDPATWKLKVSFENTLSGKLDAAASWPEKSDAQPPLMFALK